MARRDLLPGVTADTSPPRVVAESKAAIARARRRAAFYDAAQLFMLAGVDVFFLRWPTSHIPLLSREHTAIAVALVNVLFAAGIMVSRVRPRWSARRIAATWCLAERARFFANDGHDEPR